MPVADRHLATAAILVLLTGGGIASCLDRPARGQDGHAQNHDWYQNLKTPQGYSCCNADTPLRKGDCRPVQARPRDDGTWEAYFGGRWQFISPERILPDHLNRVPTSAHLCEQDGYVRCFLKGGGGS